MYYIDRQQIEDRIRFIPYIINACERLERDWNETNPLHFLAQERALHLAIETVTDVGSLLIDGFLMRDASSYEDIISILIVEKVFPIDMGPTLLALVKLRKPLVQDYMNFERNKLHPLIHQLPSLMKAWEIAVLLFIEKELT
ncbi:MAG: hypothetical protein JWM44_2149 [Bacilli bacterium]|jgi:uncharacterized protein YutE (UPF0331/DUF86 family)|nr:hypothetical protein [Bacilli bacterium]